MTSKLKCPFCGEEIKIAGERTTIMSCFNGECCGSGLYGEEAMWQALIQAKQDLEIARKAMNQVMSMGAKNNICYHLKAKTVKSILGNALEQIEHKE